MNKKTIIIIGVVAAVAVAVIAVAVTQWARLRSVASVAKSATMNEEQVTAKSAENEQITQELQDEYQIPAIELTPEMQAAIADGTMSLEEAAAQFLTGPTAEPETDTTTAPESEPETDTTTAPESVTTPDPEPETETTPVPEPETETETTPLPVRTPDPESDTETTPVPVRTPDPEPEAETTPVPVRTPDPEPETETTAPVTTPDPEPETDTTTAPEPEPAATLTGGMTIQPSAEEKAKAETDARVQNLFAQLYVLQSAFNTKVDNLINECIDEFLALDPASQTRAMKIRIVYNRMDTLTAMEDDCNAQVENIASQLDEIDPALGAKARQYYKNEKELKKSTLIATYGK